MLKRSGPIKADPAKAREWQRRGAEAYQRKQRERPAQAGDNAVDNARAPQKRSRNRTRRRNDGPWRNEVMARYGECCRRCGDTAHVQADHMWPRGQGGPSVVQNGLPLCGEFSRNTPGGCHPLKTASRIVIEPGWLEPEQIAWLAEVGWVTWDDDGQPYGRGWRHFAPRRVRGDGERVEQDGEGA